MARIAGIDLPKDKRVEIGLTYIYGIGRDVYKRQELLRQARERGHRTMNGMGLLVHQAVLALERFTGVPIDAAAMRARLIPVLSEKT